MQVRIVRGQVQPGKVDEFAARWEELIPARLREMTGFRHVYLTVNREQNMVAGIQLWDQLPDEAWAAQVVQEFLEQAKGLIAGRPTIEDYEVLVEV